MRITDTFRFHQQPDPYEWQVSFIVSASIRSASSMRFVQRADRFSGAACPLSRTVILTSQPPSAAP